MSMRLPLAAWFAALVLASSSVAQDAPEIWHTKARALEKSEMFAEAAHAYLEAINRYVKLSDRKASPPVWSCHCDHAEMLIRLERFGPAEKLLREIGAGVEALAEPDRTALLARIGTALGSLHAAMERSAPSVAEYDNAIGHWRKLTATDPAKRIDLATVLGQRGQEQLNLARYPDAEASYREAVQLWHQLIVENPKSPEHREKLALACNAYGMLAREAGRFMLARDLFRSAVQTVQTLQEALPREPKYWYHLPTFCRNWAVPNEYLHCHVEKSAALRAASKWEKRLAQLSDESHSWIAEAQKLPGGVMDQGLNSKELDALVQKAQARLKANPDVPLLRTRLISARLAQATHAASSRWYDQALEAYREAENEISGLIRSAPDVPKYRRQQASLQIKLGLVHFHKRNDQEGARLIDEALASYRRLADDFPDEPKLRRAIDEESANLMMFYLARNDDQKVIATLRVTVASLGKLCEKHPRCPEYRRHHAQAPVPLGHILMRLKRDAEAEQAFRDSLQLWSKVIEDFPEIPEYHLFQCQVRSQLLQLYHRQARWTDAEPIARDLQAAQRKLIAAIPLLEHRDTGLAVSHIWFATLAAKNKKTADAIAHYGQAISLCEKALSSQPGQREHLHLLIAALRERGALHQEAGRFAAYDQDLRQSQAWSEWLDVASVRLTRIAYRVETGQADAACRDANDLFAGGDLSGSQWFELASIYVKLLQNADAAGRDGYASRAIVALRKALDEGYRPTIPLPRDDQFRLIATRPDFQHLAQLRP